LNQFSVIKVKKRMETPQLTIQNRCSADEALADRIRVIIREKGGLGAFFEQLREQRDALEPQSWRTNKTSDAQLCELIGSRNERGKD
jgi:hypothetical protein